MTPPPAPPSADKPHDDAVWRPRGAIRAGEVNRYSKFVGTMRLALPAVAIVLLLLVLVVPLFRGGDDQFKPGELVTKALGPDSLSMTNARYSGTDAKGQPYSVSAKGVRERTGDDKRVELAAPQADVTLESGTWISLSAQSGLYDRSGDKLDLSGEVSVFQDQGYELHTESMSINLKTGNATSRAAVDGQGPFGELKATGFDLQEKGDVVMFTGPARVILNGQSAPKEGAPKDGAPKAKASP